ncbi:MAG: DUF3617 domain-containing protein [Novosphingobium sp.]
MPRFNPMAVSLALLALSACNKGAVEAKNESAQSVAEKVAAAGDIALLPGQWESTFKMEKMDIGGDMPPAAKAAMQRAMGAEHSIKTCLTPEQAKARKAAFMQHETGCIYQNFSMAGGHIEGTATCDAGGTKRTIKMSGQYAPDSYQMHVDSQMQRPGGMSVSSSMTMNAHRTGDCTGKEAG